MEAIMSFKFLSLNVALILTFLVACSTWKSNEVAQTDGVESGREIAAADSIAYPPARTFDMAQVKGQTYITFLKQKLKPTLDGLAKGFPNIGSSAYKSQTVHLSSKTYKKYRGAKWNPGVRDYTGGLTDAQVESVYETLKKIRPTSTSYSLQYFDRNDKDWATKNDMAQALKAAKINAAPFDLGTLYALTGGLGVKVKLDANNYNYHVLYKTGKQNPHEEVMSGRSFASAPNRKAADATDPEYLRDLEAYIKANHDLKPFFQALVSSLANSDTSGLRNLSDEGQAILGDFFTVYTAEAVRHLMVNLADGVHPWEIDLAAVTFVSPLSVRMGKIVTGGQLKQDSIGGWFAPSPNNQPGGPQRSGIGITRRDRKKLQAAIHAYELTTADGKKIINDIQSIIGKNHNSNDVIQGVFEYLSSPSTPASMGANGPKLAALVAQLGQMITDDAAQIEASFR
jgi:hypothetical protein